MLFRRRVRPKFAERLKETLWPRGGWSRAMRYFGKRVLRLSGSPHTIAIGFASGLFVAWSPLFGFHYLLAIGCAFLGRGNVLAAGLSTTRGNALPLPPTGAPPSNAGQPKLAGQARGVPCALAENPPTQPG